MSNTTPKETSWGKVAGWYDDHLEGDADSYHQAVVLPNLLRLMDIKKGSAVADLASGQGFFAREWAKAGAKVVATDIAPELIEKARGKGDASITYVVSPADKLPGVADESQDRISIVLAIQNIENPRDVFKECARVLKKDGKLLVVLNHPAFRIPKNSDWAFDEKDGVQYRRIAKYMSEVRSEIAMHPGKDASEITISFHRPLQWYVKALKAAGLAITGMEEWISHRESDSGPRKDAENSARKEIPIFLTLEIMKRN